MAPADPDPSDSSFTVTGDGGQHQAQFVGPYEFPEADMRIIDDILSTVSPHRNASHQSQYTMERAINNKNDTEPELYEDKEMDYRVDGGGDKRAITDRVIIGEVADDPTPKRAVYRWIGLDGRLVRRPAPVTTLGRKIDNCKEETGYPIRYGVAIHREKIRFIPPLQGVTEEQELRWLFEAIKNPQTRDLANIPPVFTNWDEVQGLFNSTSRCQAHTRRHLKGKAKGKQPGQLELDPIDPGSYLSLGQRGKVIDLGMSHPPTPGSPSQTPPHPNYPVMSMSANVTPSLRRKRNFDDFGSPIVENSNIPKPSLSAGARLFATPITKTTTSTSTRPTLTRPQDSVTEDAATNNDGAKYDICTIKNRLGMSSGLDATGTAVGNDNEHGVGRLIESLGYARNREHHYRQLLSGLLAKVVWSLEQTDHEYANQRLADYLSTMSHQFQEAGMTFRDVLADGEQQLSIPKGEGSLPNQ
ncbi:MAG: hypothetical protein M1819_007329 [Sarea resinae]|nr:MAG: hypothetical protein M1819_007329 [Sarea resinae]